MIVNDCKTAIEKPSRWHQEMHTQAHTCGLAATGAVISLSLSTPKAQTFS